eukprot:SAG11_NODE_26711_length_341_cov_3.185950_1_plen_79_part_10
MAAHVGAQGEAEAERAAFWLSELSRWDGAALPHQLGHRLASQLLPGLPPAVRPSVWQCAVGNALAIDPDSFRALREDLR